MRVDSMSMMHGVERLQLLKKTKVYEKDSRDARYEAECFEDGVISSAYSTCNPHLVVCVYAVHQLY